MCFQEVWDRFFTYKLVQSLYPEFKHFVVDVAHHSWKNNCYFGSKLSNDKLLFTGSNNESEIYFYEFNTYIHTHVIIFYPI